MVFIRFYRCSYNSLSYQYRCYLPGEIGTKLKLSFHIYDAINRFWLHRLHLHFCTIIILQFSGPINTHISLNPNCTVYTLPMTYSACLRFKTIFIYVWASEVCVVKVYLILFLGRWQNLTPNLPTISQLDVITFTWDLMHRPTCGDKI